MCTYSMISDWAMKWVPDLSAPTPYRQPSPWERQQLLEFEELLRRVKEMEDKLEVCPCPDDSKQEFLKLIKDRLDGDQST